MGRSADAVSGWRSFPIALLILAGAVASSPAVAVPVAEASTASSTNWLLLVFTAGGGTATQLGPPWSTEKSCTAAKTAVDAFMLRQRGNALVDGTRSAKSESECVAVPASSSVGRTDR